MYPPLMQDCVEEFQLITGRVSVRPQIPFAIIVDVDLEIGVRKVAAFGLSARDRAARGVGYAAAIGL